MPPARPEATRSSSRIDETDERQSQQAGRSAANLNAAASAQSLRQTQRPSPQDPTQRVGSPNLLRKKSRPQSAIGSNNHNTNGSASGSSSPAPPVPRAVTPGTMRQQGAASAPRPPPLLELESDASSESFSVHAISDEPRAEARARTTTVPPGTAISMPPSETPRRPLTGRSESTKRESYPSTNRLSNPRSVRELGSDYTRYYNPFATRNNSQQDLSATPDASTHLMPSAAISSTDLHRRLSSNPFRVSPRTSDDFDSRQNTAPASPERRLHSRDQEPDALAAAAAMGGAGAVASSSAAAASIPRHGTPSWIREADPEKTSFYPYVDDRLGAPDHGFPLFIDSKEDDDDLHMPQWDDDIRLKPKLRDHFTRENIVSTFGMMFMLAGMLCIFVVLPAVSYTGTSLIPYGYDTPLDQMPGSLRKIDPSSWEYVNGNKYSLMENLRTGLIDPDTPSSAMSRTDINGNNMKLVFSDEFNAKNRTFYPGDDPFWYAFDGWYGATKDLEWYDPDAVNTGDGTLQIQLDQFRNHNLNYRSGMLNSWNQVCFKGGVFEVSVSLPGPAGVHGWWPGVWTMGNLGRPGYLATTDGMWPYTYNDCDAGITPNQSMTDGTSYLPGQRLPSCTCSEEDHPSQGTGRGAPEIDIIEVSGDWGQKGLGVATQSFQVAPFDIWYYPNYDFMEIPDYSLSFVNTYTGGPYQQAISTTTMLNNAWFDGKQYQKYAFEYAPGGDENAYIQWYVGDDEMMKFDARAVGPNGIIGQRMISEEPMSMVLNLGFSHSWVDIDFTKLKVPAVMRVDYVRWYQVEGEEMVTCDPPGYETTDYIANHPEAYNNPNLTHWADAGYSWPKNTLMNGCSM